MNNVDVQADKVQSIHISDQAYVSMAGGEVHAFPLVAHTIKELFHLVEHRPLIKLTYGG